MIQFRASRCPSGALLMSRRAVCARLEARCSPCSCRRRLVLRLKVPAPASSVSSPNRLRCPSAFSLCSRLLSIWSWGIFLYKWWTFRRAAKQSAQFLEVFRRSNKFSEVQAVCRSLGDSPLVGLFQTGYAELTAQLRQAAPPDAANGPNPRAPAGRPTLEEPDGGGPRAAARVGGRGQQARKRVSFLATTASMAPFVGLFGTVWGIMSAFEAVGRHRFDESRRRSRPASPKR